MEAAEDDLWRSLAPKVYKTNVMGVVSHRRDGQNRMAKTGLVHVRRRLGNTMKPVQLLESVPVAASVAYMALDDTTNEALAQAMSPKRVLWIIGGVTFKHD